MPDPVSDTAHPPEDREFENCPRCQHNAGAHGVNYPLIWCWECQLPCGKLRWPVMQHAIQTDMDNGIEAQTRGWAGGG